MNLIDRAKNILTTPKTEWLVISTETATPSSLFTGYLLPLALIPAAATLLGTLLRGGVMLALAMALVALIGAIVSYYVSIYVVDALAPSFDSEKNINGSAKLVAYSYTASAVAGILSFIPGLGSLIALAGFVYFIYLMYLGLTPIKGTPEDKKVVYLVVIFIVQVAVYFAISSIVVGVFLTGLLGGATLLH